LPAPGLAPLSHSLTSVSTWALFVGLRRDPPPLRYFGAPPSRGVCVGFLHALLFVFVRAVDRPRVLTVHGGLSVAGGWGVLAPDRHGLGILIGTFAWAVQRLALRSIGLACLVALHLDHLEFVREHLPEISFPWNLLGYPAAENLAFVQLTTITGIYGLLFSSPVSIHFSPGQSHQIFARRATVWLRQPATAILLIVAPLLPAWFRKISRTISRAPRSSIFLKSESYPPNWFKCIRRARRDRPISLAPSAEKPDLLVRPEAPLLSPFRILNSRR